MNAMNLEMTANCLRVCIEQDIPAFLWGAPGVGKSEVIDQVGVDLDMPVIDFRASLRDAVDLRGLPLVDEKEGTTRWLPPAELPNVKTHGPRGILKLDELNTAPQSVQAACFGLVLERRLGEYELPAGWVPIAAGNRMADRAAAQRVPSALKNRFAHFECLPDVPTWTKWATTKGNIHPLVVAFMRFRPELLHVMPKNDEENAFPTPRAWSKVSRVTDSLAALRPYLVESIVGRVAAGEFEAFVQVYEAMPDVQAILKGDKSQHVPNNSEAGALYAVSAALGRLAARDNLVHVVEYAKRLPREFEVMTVVDAVRRDPKLKTAKGFTDWAVRNQEVAL
jgi:hypothetical protein